MGLAQFGGERLEAAGLGGERLGLAQRELGLPLLATPAVRAKRGRCGSGALALRVDGRAGVGQHSQRSRTSIPRLQMNEQEAAGAGTLGQDEGLRGSEVERPGGAASSNSGRSPWIWTSCLARRIPLVRRGHGVPVRSVVDREERRGTGRRRPLRRHRCCSLHVLTWFPVREAEA